MRNQEARQLLWQMNALCRRQGITWPIADAATYGLAVVRLSDEGAERVDPRAFYAEPVAD